MQEIKNINAGQIDEPHDPMRTKIDRDAVWELSESIKRQGLINPITVRPVGERFEVVAGHRRFTACKIAGVISIPCVVRTLDDEAVQDIMAAENLERQDVNPVDEALFLGKMIGEDTTKIKEIALRLNRSEQWVNDRLEILTYPEYMIEQIQTGALKLGVASWLGAIEDDFWRKQYVDSAIRQGMSVTQARYLHDQWKMGVTPSSDNLFPDVSEISNGAVPAARANCAACGRIAIDPNLQNVFIHRECPSDEVASAPVSDSLPPARPPAPAENP